jgi:hypothetical protein
MPFQIEGSRVVLDGHCSVEEAAELFQALIAIDRPVFSLEGVESMHTAIAQVLLAARGALEASPADRTLAACLAPLEPVA